MRILIVDDSADDRLLLSTILKKAGYASLILAASAHEAFTLLEQGGMPPLADLILMDLLMPEMDGLAALRRLKGELRWRDIPVVMVTGQREVSDLAASFAAGAVDYIAKPINRVELLARLHAVIALEQANFRLRRNEQHLRVMTDSLAEGLVALDQTGQITFLNPSGELLLGRRREELHTQSFFSCLADPSMVRLFTALLAGEWQQRSGEMLLRRLDGATFLASYSAAPLQDEGRVTGVVVTFQDITQRKLAEERLRLAAKVIETSSEGIIITDAAGRIEDVNPAFTFITGYSLEEVVGRNPRLLGSGRAEDGFYQEMWRTLKLTDRWQGEIWNRRKSGEVYPEWLSISALRDDHGEVSHFVGIFTDITTRKTAEQRLEQLAHYDLLTGLPNRMLLMDRLRQALAKARRDQSTVALLYLDLDHFKPINDRHGHEVGDAVLQVVSRRLSQALRQSDTVARIGGDEFILLLQDIQLPGDAEAVASKVIQMVSQEIPVEPHRCTVGCSIGIAHFPSDAQDIDVLINLADAAMYQAKGGGRNRYCVYPSATG